MLPILSEIQRKHNPTISSRDLPMICLAGKSFVDQVDWTIGRLVVVLREGDITTIFRTDKCEINAILGMDKC